MMSGTLRAVAAIAVAVSLALLDCGPILDVSIAEAASFTVDSQTDAVDASPGDGLCATAALPSEGVRCTLRAAIQEANALAGADIINLPAGTYARTLAGLEEDAAAQRDLDVTGPLTILGAGQDATTISASQQGRVFDIHASATTVAMSDLTVRDGSVEFAGGGIYNRAALTLTDVAVTNNQALIQNYTGSGGGVSSQNDGSSLTLIRVRVSSNLGGGVSVHGGPLTATDSVFTNNTKVGEHNHVLAGIGLGYSGDGPVTLMGVTVSNNGSIGGVGDALRINSGTGDITVNRVTVSDNSTTYRFGGAVLEGRVTVVDSTFTRNRASQASPAPAGTVFIRPAAGAPSTFDRVTISDANPAVNYGLHVAGTGTLIVRDSRISGNLYGVYNDVGATVELTRTTVAGNNSHGIANVGNLTVTDSLISMNQGIGIWNLPGRTATVTNVSLIGNNSGSAPGAGIANAGVISVTNATIAGNVASVAAGQSLFNAADATFSIRNSIVSGAIDAPLCYGAFATQGHNLETGTTCGFVGPGDRQRTDPQISPLTDHGGPTQTARLLPGSPAIDAGANTGCPLTDQRGFPRPRDGDANGSAICDIGAYELQDPYPAAPPSPPTPTPTACAPRPAVSLRTAQIGPGQIRGTLSATTTALQPSNAFTQVQIVGLTNATATVNGAPVTAGQTIPLPAGATQAQVVVTRSSPGAFTARLAATDACGAYQTFVGGGSGVP